ncbi:TPA: transposase, partial [Candidatus Poribacteria bacterium]|nr:transposase [Candidatus Poribacteria bacterium]
MLPNDFPPWKSVYGYFREWKKSGLWQRIHEK